MQPVIIAHNLVKRFRDVTAVEGVSLEVSPGEILGLLGPNGAGKTTTFQMLLGILSPTSGEISFFGKDLTKHRSDILERINFSSTYTNLPWNLKVRDTLAFMSRLYRLTDRKRRVDEIIEVFRLSPLLDKFVRVLSAGEVTRLNLAKAFLNNPEVILMDEPTASLDPESAHEVRQFILQRRKESGMSVLFTSHNMGEVETVCDRVVFIHRGRVVANDTPVNLARSLDTCNVSLIVDPGKLSDFNEVCLGSSVTATTQDGFSTVVMRESAVSHFLNALHVREVPLHGLTVTRATLEDYFLTQAHTAEVVHG